MKKKRCILLGSAMVAFLCSWGAGCSKEETKKNTEKKKTPASRYEASELDLSLPAGRAPTEVTQCTEVVVGRRSVFVNGKAVVDLLDGKVKDESLRDGADGFFITQLYRRLKMETKKLEAQAKNAQKAFSGCMTLAMDKKTPYLSMARVLYTASQAEFSRYQLLVRRKDGTLGSVIIETPRLHTAKAGPRGGFVAAVRSGSTGKKGFAEALARHPFEVGGGMGSGLASIVVSGGSGTSIGIGGWVGFGSGPPSKGAGDRKEPIGPRPSGSLERRMDGMMKSFGLGTKMHRGMKGSNAHLQRTRPFICNHRALPVDRAEIGVLIHVDAQGRVDKVASKGAGLELEICCIRPYVASLELDPQKVPEGVYGFGVRMAQQGSASAVSLPREASLRPLVRPVQRCIDGSLNLTLVLTEKGYYLKSRYGAECTDDPDGPRMCAEWKSDRTQALSHLARRLRHLFLTKYGHPRFWRYSQRLRGTITFVPENSTRFGDLIRVLEILRDLPAESGAAAGSGQGCRMRLDPGTSAWKVDEAARKECMYPHVVLAMGST